MGLQEIPLLQLLQIPHMPVRELPDNRMDELRPVHHVIQHSLHAPEPRNLIPVGAVNGGAHHLRRKHLPQHLLDKLEILPRLLLIQRHHRRLYLLQILLRGKHVQILMGHDIVLLIGLYDILLNLYAQSGTGETLAHRIKRLRHHIHLEMLPLEQLAAEIFFHPPEKRVFADQGHLRVRCKLVPRNLINQNRGPQAGLQVIGIRHPLSALFVPLVRRNLPVFPGQFPHYVYILMAHTLPSWLSPNFPEFPEFVSLLPHGWPVPLSGTRQGHQ